MQMQCAISQTIVSSLRLNAGEIKIKFLRFFFLIQTIEIFVIIYAQYDFPIFSEGERREKLKPLKLLNRED